MEQPFDASEMMTRVSEVAKEVRKSEAYPAILGGIAGGVAGALMAVIVASALSSKREQAPASETVAAKETSHAAFSVRDTVQLLTVVATLVRQVQAWYKDQRK